MRELSLALCSAEVNTLVEVTGIFKSNGCDCLQSFSCEECLVGCQDNVREHCQSGCNVIDQEVIGVVCVNVGVFAFVYVKTDCVELAVLQGFDQSFCVDEAAACCVDEERCIASASII